MPTHFTEDLPRSTSERAVEHTRSAALEFWRSFAQSDDEKALAALKFLTDLRGDGGDELFEASLESPGSSGKFVKVELPSTSPRSAQDAWDSEKKTHLMLVDPSVHCLALDGDIAKYQGGGFFVACGSKGAKALDAGACSVGTHSHADRVKVPIDGPAFLVKMRSSSAATKPKVLAGALLYERDLPPMLTSEVFEEILLGYEAPPRVWKMILDNYPGVITMANYLSITDSQSGGRSRASLSEPGPRDQLDNLDPEVPFEVGGVGNEFESGFNGPLDEQMIRSVVGGQRLYAGRLGLAVGDVDSVSAAGSGAWSEFSFTGQNRNTSSVARSLDQDPGANRWGQAWKAPLATLDKQLKSTRDQVSKKFAGIEEKLDQALGYLDDNLKLEFSKVYARDDEAVTALDTANKRLAFLEGEVQRLARRDAIPGGSLTIDTDRHRAKTPPPSFNWGTLSAEEQGQLVRGVLDQIDLAHITETVGTQLGIAGIRTEVGMHGDRLTNIEQEFTTEHGVVGNIQAQLANLEAKRNTSSCERGGYVFSGVPDVQALVQLVGPGKLATHCLDLISLLTLAQDPYVTYEAGVQVHANAIKANFGSVVESRIKVSFEIPFPELMVKMVENSTTSSRGGAKWAPMFQSAEGFEDDFRDGAHRRVLRGIESAYELTQKAIDQEFPLGIPGPTGGNNRKIHTILTDQNRRAYRQTVGFVECLLPFYRTLKGGSLTSEDSWDRVFVFVLELLTSLQEERVVSTDLSAESAMMWGCFRATDLGEEFRKQKFVEHPKALSILALTSIEREGKTMQKLEDRIAKQIADAGKGDKFTKLDTKIQQLDNKIKNIIAKNPDLK